MWHFMGVMLSAAGSLQWFRDTLAPGVSFNQLLSEASVIPAGSEGLLFLPYLSGERTPHPDPLARGAFVGLTLRHSRAHMTRAVLEGVALGLKDSFSLIQDAGLAEIREVRASGGGTKGALWREILASVLDCDLQGVACPEGAAFGAALLAGVGVGIAAGLKLTPAFFVIIFLVQRRFVAAAVSAATFLATVVAGFFIVPDAGAFWRSAVFDSGRVGVHENPGAQSIRSLLVRLGADSTLLWLALALGTTALTAFAAWFALRRGNRTVAMALTGIGACLVSPFSWFHHWVWIVPLTVAVIAGVASLIDARGILPAQLGALLTAGLVFIMMLPYVSGVLWPALAYPGPWISHPHPVWRLAYTGFGIAFILGYLGWARNSAISATKPAGSVS